MSKGLLYKEAEEVLEKKIQEIFNTSFQEINKDNIETNNLNIGFQAIVDGTTYLFLNKENKAYRNDQLMYHNGYKGFQEINNLKQYLSQINKMLKTYSEAITTD